MITHLSPLAQKIAKGFVLLSFSVSALATQYIDVSDGKPVLAKISAREMTLIKMESVRIHKVRHNSSEVMVEADEDKGEIYIKPLNPGRKPINLFITTEHSSFPLIAEVIDVPAEVIILRERITSSKQGGGSGEHTSNHVRAVKNLLLAIATDEPLPAYTVKKYNREIPLWKEVRFVLKRSLLGPVFVADQYALVNRSSTQQILDEQEFYSEGVVGVAIAQATLAPGEQTDVYIIREKQSHEQ